MTPQKPTKKKSPAEARAKLAAGAKEPEVAKGVVDDTFPEIEECALEIPALIKKRVTLDTLKSHLTLDEKTTPGEYAKLFDYFTHYGECVQFLIGDLIIEGEKLPSFGGKYAQAMLATGRSLDSLKAYRLVASRTLPEDRRLPFTHTRETTKIPRLEDRRAVIDKCAKLADEGKLPSVMEVRALADKYVPRKKKGATPAPTVAEGRDILTPEENTVLAELVENGAAFASHLEMSQFIHEASDKHTAKLREIVKRIHSVHLQFTA